MTTATRRTIARICIWVCLVLVVFAALALTIDPARFPPGAMLRTDIPALVSIVAARLYLHSTAAR